MPFYTQEWDRALFIAAALSAALAVALGAFGAHALRDTFTASQLANWHTAVSYQLWHTLAAVGFAHLDTRKVGRSGWILLIGALLFSGSIYALSLGAPRPVAYITPIGGTLMLTGWLRAAWLAFRARN